MARRPRPQSRPKPKVWHNPDVIAAGAPRREAKVAEAPQQPAAPEPERKRAQRLAPAAAQVDPREAERDRLLSRLLAAEGRAAISKAAGGVVPAGFEVPADHQEAQMQLLEHQDDRVVLTAIERLGGILASEPVRRFMVLESRLRRLEELADDADIQSGAANLRRQVLARRA